MPMGPQLLLKFELNVVDHDVLLVFELKPHRELKYSSNEYDNTFTHHPSGTIVPVTSREEQSNMGDIYKYNGHQVTCFSRKPKIENFAPWNSSTDTLAHLIRKRRKQE